MKGSGGLMEILISLLGEYFSPKAFFSAFAGRLFGEFVAKYIKPRIRKDK